MTTLLQNGQTAASCSILAGPSMFAESLTWNCLTVQKALRHCIGRCLTTLTEMHPGSTLSFFPFSRFRIIEQKGAFCYEEGAYINHFSPWKSKCWTWVRTSADGEISELRIYKQTMVAMVNDDQCHPSSVFCSLIRLHQCEISEGTPVFRFTGAPFSTIFHRLNLRSLFVTSLPSFPPIWRAKQSDFDPTKWGFPKVSQRFEIPNNSCGEITIVLVKFSHLPIFHHFSIGP